MPSRCKGSSDRQVIIMGSFLSGLSSAVSALTRFVLGDANRSAVPIHPRDLKVRNFASPKPESAGDETDKSRLEILWRWEGSTRFQQEFELAVGENILVGMPSRERPAMSICPFRRRLIMMGHPWASSCW